MMTIYGATLETDPLYDDEQRDYDALLFMSFGGPEGMDEVIPFLERVTKGRNVPRERLEQVAEHYYHFDGVSPINGQNRELIAALEDEFKTNEMNIPIYFGNRNSEPFITDTIEQMKTDGIDRAAAFVTAGFSCYSGCRQYRENIIKALDEVGDQAPEIDKLRMFYNHPGFITAQADRVKDALANFDTDEVHLIFTAHSIPLGMADNSDYVVQLEESCRLVAEQVGTENYTLAYQSRSGPPFIPWLEPDILDYMDSLPAKGIDNIIIVPIGFISDHMEVLFDLDIEAVEKAEELNINMVRAATVGTHPEFVKMIRLLVEERMEASPQRLAIGNRPANHDICPVGCCQQGAKRPARARE